MYQNEGRCVKCKNTITNTNMANMDIECEFCSDKYHLNYLSTKEYCDICLKDYILFICNTCQKNLNQLLL